MKIPYGLSNFRQIREEGFFYADKTTFLPLLESGEMGYRYLIFLRPRRFGKSTLLSMMGHYYDLAQKDQFDQLFGGLWVHEHPTPNRNRYLVLTLDFSGVSIDGDQAELQESFTEVVRKRVKGWMERYRSHFPEIERHLGKVDDHGDASALLGDLLRVVQTTGHRLYLFIDEYDHFANRLLSRRGPEAYEAAVGDRTSFLRTFYANIKIGTQTGAIDRIFITGVSPLGLDHLVCGFHGASHVSQDPMLNALAGFTRTDVERLVDGLLLPVGAENTALTGLPDRGELVRMMEAHYGGYRFSDRVEERVFCPGMMLYFLAELARRRTSPFEMLDPDLRGEYERVLRSGALSTMTTSEPRAVVAHIQRQGHIESRPINDFGNERLFPETQVLSSLYHGGLLTLGRRSPDRATQRLEIPNRVIRDLRWE